MFCFNFFLGDFEKKFLKVVIELCESLKIVMLAFSGQTMRAEKMAKLSAFVDDVKLVVELLNDKRGENETESETQANPILGELSYRLRTDLSV